MSQPATLRVTLNDQPHELSAPATLLGLLLELRLADRKGIALAVNDTVVPRSQWPQHQLQNNDRLLLIQATQGG